jgi:hypothetical protein
MPWREASPMDQRTQFIADHLREVWSITELCASQLRDLAQDRLQVDRPLPAPGAGLEERSRRPRRAPNQTPDAVVAAILDTRRRHPSWGGKKLLALLHRRHPRWDLPGRSTACGILRRHGLVPLRRSRRRIGHPGKPTSQILAPNDVWSADYKGQFRTGNGRYCHAHRGCLRPALPPTCVTYVPGLFCYLSPRPFNVELMHGGGGTSARPGAAPIPGAAAA